MNRMSRWSCLGMLVLAVIAGLVSAALAQETPRMGGVLKVATIGEPISGRARRTECGAPSHRARDATGAGRTPRAGAPCSPA
jgi:hypothetical protein